MDVRFTLLGGFLNVSRFARMCKNPTDFLCVKKLRFLNVSKRSVSNVSTLCVEFKYAGCKGSNDGRNAAGFASVGRRCRLQRTSGA